MYFNYYFLLLWVVLLIGLPCKVQTKSYAMFPPNEKLATGQKESNDQKNIWKTVDVMLMEKDQQIEEMNKNITKIQNIIAQNTQLIEGAKILPPSNDPKVSKVLKDLIQQYEDTEKEKRTQLRWFEARKHDLIIELTELQNLKNGDSKGLISSQDIEDINDLPHERKKNITEIQNMIAENTRWIQDTKKFLPSYDTEIRKNFEDLIQQYEDNIKAMEAELKRYEAGIHENIASNKDDEKSIPFPQNLNDAVSPDTPHARKSKAQLIQELTKLEKDYAKLEKKITELPSMKCDPNLSRRSDTETAYGILEKLEERVRSLLVENKDLKKALKKSKDNLEVLQSKYDDTERMTGEMMKKEKDLFEKLEYILNQF